jgi:hypothetical protein
MAVNGKMAAKLTVKFDKVLQRDEHVIFTVYGDSLEELNENARELIMDYKAYNNIEGTAKYYLGDQPGSIASTLDAIGSL